MSGRRVVLHVGLMKSGTSFLQSLLYTNRDLLLERGILLPGERWAYQVRAVRSLINEDGQLWDRLADEVRAYPGTSVVSMEFLGPLKTPNVRRLVASLEGVEVEVIITARDLNRSIAAMWQETVQNGRTWGWDEYVDALTAWRPGHRAGQQITWAGRTFWRQQNLVRIARTWAGVVGPENVTVVTVPHPGAPRGLLWERFASVLGTDPSGLQPASAANESIGAASTLALRRLNELLEADGLTFDDGARLRKGTLAKRVMAARKGEEPVTGLPVADWVHEQSRQVRRNVEAIGLQVMGDLDELAPVDVPGVHPDTVDPAQVAEAALAALTWVLGERIRAEAEAGTAPAPRSGPGDDEEDHLGDPGDGDWAMDGDAGGSVPGEDEQTG